MAVVRTAAAAREQIQNFFVEGILEPKSMLAKSQMAVFCMKKSLLCCEKLEHIIYGSGCCAVTHGEIPTEDSDISSSKKV